MVVACVVMVEACLALVTVSFSRTAFLFVTELAILSM